MYRIERQRAILKHLEKEAASVELLAHLLNSSNATVRRDLKELADLGKLTRTHGGAVGLPTSNAELPFVQRDSEQQSAKDRMARIAVRLINDGETVFLDSSSSVLRLVPLLSSKKNITVITTGIRTAYELSKLSIRTICTGGYIAENSSSLLGINTITTIGKYFADKLFFSCRAIDEINGLYESSEDTSEVKTTMMFNSKKSFLLADHSKFDKTAFSKLCSIEKLSGIITNLPLSEEWTVRLKRLNINLYY